MLIRRVLVSVLTLAAALSTSCSFLAPTAPLPDSQLLLREAAASVRTIHSGHSTLKSTVPVSEFGLIGVEGDFTRDGNAKGTVDVEQLGQRLRMEFALINKILYIKGPTGGYVSVPGGTGMYDPSAILDPNRGVAQVLEHMTDVKTRGRETVDGISTYKVTGRVSKNAVADLVPGAPSDVDVTIWLREDAQHQPVRASLQLPPANPGVSAPTVNLTLSQINKPVTITVPPTQ